MWSQMGRIQSEIRVVKVWSQMGWNKWLHWLFFYYTFEICMSSSSLTKSDLITTHICVVNFPLVGQLLSTYVL